MCETDFENSWHIFICCSYAQSCWSVVGLFVEIDRLAFVAEGFVELLFFIQHIQDKIQMGNFVCFFGICGINEIKINGK